MSVIAPIIDRVTLIAFTSLTGARIDAQMLNGEIQAYADARGKYLNLEINGRDVATTSGFDDICSTVIKWRVDGYNIFFTNLTSEQEHIFTQIVNGLLSAI